MSFVSLKAVSLCLTPRPSSHVAVPEAKVWEEEYDLNAVRLCFQATITLATGELYPLAPVVSQPIYDNSECAEIKPTRHSVEIKM